jgi:hypothetical protein
MELPLNLVVRGVDRVGDDKCAARDTEASTSRRDRDRD